MTLPLPPNLQQFADRQIASGKYTSVDEMMLAGLRVLAEQEQVYQGGLKNCGVKCCLEC